MVTKQQFGRFLWVTAIVPFCGLFGLIGLSYFQNARASNALQILAQARQANPSQPQLLDRQIQQANEALAWQRVTLVGGGLLQSAIVVIFLGGVVFKVTQSLKKAANEVTVSVSEIAQTLEQQEHSIAQQATAVNQTTTTIDELGSAARLSAEQAVAAATGAQQALNLAKEGTQAVTSTLEGMAVLKGDVDAIARKITQLSEQTSQIGNISSLVSDLANQTNMLALNAAVEAVRAGEHGRGFSVVATEIRKLADESKKAASKINHLVGDIQGAISETVMVTDSGTKNVDVNVQITQETTESFQGVVEAVNNIFLSTQQISLTAQQQAIAIQQVVTAMNQINEAARETVNNVSQVKAGTQKLSNAAQYLKSLAE